MTISKICTEYTVILFFRIDEIWKRLNLILTLLLVTQHFHPVRATYSQTEKALLSTLAVTSAGALYAFGLYMLSTKKFS